MLTKNSILTKDINQLKVVAKLIKCHCGCGQKRLNRDKWGRSRLFIKGHVSEDTKQKRRLACLGKTLSEQTKKKIGLANSGNKPSKDARKKMSLKHLGKKLSEETKNNMRLAQSGRKHSEYTKNKIRLSHLGKTLSEETKLKIRLAHQKQVFPIGNKSPSWKGDNVGYNGLHLRINKLLPRPLDSKCLFCHQIKHLEKACVTGVYNMNMENWAWLCRSCHNKHDIKIGLRKPRGYVESKRLENAFSD
jgi:hypothetical protein